MAKKQPDKNSTAEIIRLRSISGADKPPVVPKELLKFKNKYQKTMWKHITKARLNENWRDADLILVHNMVMQQWYIHEAQLKLREEGVFKDYGNGRGEVEHKGLKIINDATKSYHSSLTKLSLNQLPADARTINGQAATHNNTMDNLSKTKDPHRLLARTN